MRTSATSLFNMITFYYFGAMLLERTIGTPMFVTLYAMGLLLSQLLVISQASQQTGLRHAGRLGGDLRGAVRCRSSTTRR